MRKTLLLATALLMLASQARASVTIIGWGSENCSDWNDVRTQGNYDQQTTDFRASTLNNLKNWVLGDFSGQAQASGTDILNGTTADSLWTALDSECQLRPNESVADAVVAIANRLSN